MRTISLAEVSAVVDKLLAEIVPLIDSNIRSHSTVISDFDFHVSFIDTLVDGVVSTGIKLNKSKLVVLAFPLHGIDQFLPSAKSAIYFNIVSKMFKHQLQGLTEKLVDNIDTMCQETINIAFGHWVKLEQDPRARSGMRMSYGDDEGTLMSTPVDDPGQSIQYVISSLRGRADSIPWVTPKEKTITVNLSTFKCD